MLAYVRIVMSIFALRIYLSFLLFRGGATRGRLVADYVLPLSHSARSPLLLIFLLYMVILAVLCISLFLLNLRFFARTRNIKI